MRCSSSTRGKSDDSEEELKNDGSVNRPTPTNSSTLFSEVLTVSRDSMNGLNNRLRASKWLQYLLYIKEIHENSKILTSGNDEFSRNVSKKKNATAKNAIGTAIKLMNLIKIP